jgi:hypothetical protein
LAGQVQKFGPTAGTHRQGVKHDYLRVRCGIWAFG